MNSVMGPWTADIQDISLCDSVTQQEYERHTIGFHFSGRYNTRLRRRIFDGSLDYRITLNYGDLQALAEIAKWDSVGGWKENFFVVRGGDPCVLVQTFAHSIWAVMRNVSTPTLPAACPINKGNRTMANWDLSVDSLASMVAAVPYGRYKARLILLAAKEVKCCIQITAKVSPKAY